MRHILIVLACLVPVAAFAGGATQPPGLLPGKNLADLPSAATARTNLGLGTLATQNAASAAITGGSILNADGSGMNVTAIGGTVARTPAERAADVVNVREFGAVGDDTHDDTAAINAAISYIRTSRSAGPFIPGTTTQTYTARLIFPQGAYKITGSIDLTNLVSLSVMVDGGGSVIDCQATGAACLDAMKSRFLTINNLAVIAPQSTAPSVGIQFGRTTFSSAGNIRLTNVTFNGYFSIAGIYNLASEDSNLTHVIVWNFQTNAHDMILDGMNHFNLPTLAPGGQTNPVDTGISFLADTFTDVELFSYGTGGTPLWQGGGSQHRWINSYMAQVAGGYAVDFYSIPTYDAFSALDMDVHFETSTLTDVFFFTGTDPTPIFNGFHYRDAGTEATNSVLKVDTGVTSVTMRNVVFDIATYQTQAAKLFDNPSIWTVSGQYWSANANQFNPPATWQGPVLTAQTWVLGAYGSSAILAQTPDNTTTGGNSRGAGAVDLQQARTAAAQVAGGANSTIVGGASNRANGANAVVGGFANSTFGNDDVAFGAAHVLTGTFSASPGGSNSADHGDFGKLSWASGQFAQQGDAQAGWYVLRASVAAGATSKLTADGLAAGSTNIVNLANNSAFAFGRAVVVCFDYTNIKAAEWHIDGLLVHRGASASTTAIVGTPTISLDQVDSSLSALVAGSLTVTADTTNGGVNFSINNGTTVGLRCVLKAATTEVM